MQERETPEKGKLSGDSLCKILTNGRNESGERDLEYLFRTSLRVIASIYIQFLIKLAEPLFVLLHHDFKMVPGFEAAAALKYNPYPDPRYRITFDDLFWHLDKESMEDTFDRLLERHTYDILRSFLQKYFQSRARALAAVCEHTSFGAMLTGTGAVVLKQDDVVEDRHLLVQHSTIWGTAFGPVKFEVYQGRKVRFGNGSDKKFTEAYADFRACLFEERKRQGRNNDPWS